MNPRVGKNRSNLNLRSVYDLKAAGPLEARILINCDMAVKEDTDLFMLGSPRLTDRDLTLSGKMTLKKIAKFLC